MFSLGIMIHSPNPSTWKVEAVGLPGFKTTIAYKDRSRVTGEYIMRI